ncbi:MAG: class I SAM-dependent methyltransferase, partial [Clostridia bacterium]|nr:class I SAM-dependent methyltransferase [Clostridia bacterium]
MRFAKWEDYELIDVSSGQRLERWGDQILVRPDPQIIWDTPKTDPRWTKFSAIYHRSNTGGGSWEYIKKLPESWQINYKNLKFNVKTMNFKHTGVFPEQAVNWDLFKNIIKESKRKIKVLNLFAYTGGATLACASAGAEVCHVDASKGMVSWARENAIISGLSNAPIRWIVDDCEKFVLREIRRGHKY